MRIGVVCEGPTDYHAIDRFFCAALGDAGIAAQCVALQPQMDNTNPVGGWTHVLLWLENNSPHSRIQRYFGGGLFAGQLGEPPLDCILIQMDSDILADPSFQTHVKKTLDYDVINAENPDERAQQIRQVVEIVAKLRELTEADRRRHVVAPAVESTEAWCAAAFNSPVQNTEILKGQQLTDIFMIALETSESRTPNPPYAKMNKDPERRKTFCHRHAAGYSRIVQGCAQFGRALSELVELKTEPTA